MYLNGFGIVGDACEVLVVLYDDLVLCSRCFNFQASTLEGAAEAVAAAQAPRGDGYRTSTDNEEQQPATSRRLCHCAGPL